MTATARKRREKIVHQALEHSRRRLAHDGSARERVFAEEWENDNKKNPGVNFGQGILQDLMFDQQREGSALVGFSVLRRGEWKEIINARDARIVATVVQWLGTNVGFSFVQRCLERCGYRIVERTDKWNRNEKIKRVSDRTSSMVTCPHCGRLGGYRDRMWPRAAIPSTLTPAAFFPATDTEELRTCDTCGGRYKI